MQRELRYKVLREEAVVESGVGETVNMGSGGVCFAVENQIERGAYIQLSIAWPVLLAGSCPMRLVAFGRVLRSAAGECACSIEKYEFRTQGRTPQPPAVREDSMLQRWADTARREDTKPRFAML